MNPTIFHETKNHGQLTFPYIVYRGKIPEYIPSYPLHWHDEMELIYIKSGSGIITIQSHQYKVKANDILLILPQTVHSIEGFQNVEMEYFNILFHFSLLSISKEDICYEKYFKPLYHHTKSVSPYLEADSSLNQMLQPHILYLINNRKNRYTDNELMVKSQLFTIMYHINQHSFLTSQTELSLKNNYDTLKDLLLYVQSNYKKNIAIKDAAKICGFSTSHFMKLFKELTGKSFSQYLINYRLEIAAMQLREHNFKIIDIAENTGFHNLSYFTRAFREKYKMTPSEYRKRTS